MISSMAAFIGRPLLSPGNQFVKDPAFSPTCWWTAPLFHRLPEAFDPSYEAEVFRQVVADDCGTSAVFWFCTISVGRPAAVLMTVVLGLALTVDRPTTGLEPASTAMVRAMKIGAVDNKVAVPLRPLKAPQREQPTENVVRNGAAYTATKRSRHVLRTTYRGPVREPIVIMRYPIENPKRLLHDCSSQSYTYYAMQRGSKAFCCSSSHSFLRAAADSMHLCNHAANWFMSLGSCLSSCVHWKGDKPDDRCYKSTFFSPCT
ncbi:hypothetical protein V5799_033565, partial [Amblyomma americanum]